MIRRVRRNARKVLNSKLKKIALSSSLVFALSVSIAGAATAQGVISNNLPVPNYIDGATFKYDNSSSIQTGNVNQQAAKIAADRSSQLDIGVNKAVADLRYNSYNIAKNRVVNYNFSAAGQVALNRVTLANPSFIHGNINGANGKVFLINPNGILFGADSTVNVGAFMASTHNYKGKAADLLSGKIELTRDNNVPTGIFLEKGAVINAHQGVVFSANGIVNLGAKINASNSTAQLITGDGVNFYLDSGTQEVLPVNPDHVKAPTSTINSVKHPNAYIQPGIHQMGGTNRIDANNITIVSKVNSTLSHPFLQFVNLEGLNTTKTVSTKSGNIFIHSENVNGIGQAGGINVKGALKAYGHGGEITLKADKIDLNNNVYSETISLMPSTPNMEILLGEGTAINPNSYQLLYNDLKYINSKNINVGNDTNSYIHGTINMPLPDSAAVNLTLKTRGDVKLDIGQNYPNSLLQFTDPGNVLLTGTAPGVGITTGNIISADSIIIIVTDEDIITGDLCASVDDNQTIDELIKLQVIGTGNIETQNITAKVGNNNTINNDLVSLTTENGDIQTEIISLSLGSQNVFENNILNINTSGADFGNIKTDDIKIDLQDGNKLSNTDTNIASFEADGNITTNNIELNTGDKNEFSDGMDLESKKKLDIAKLTLNIGNKNLINDEIIDIDGDTKLTISYINVKLCDGNTVGDNVIDAESSQGDIDTGNININIGKNNFINNLLDAETEGDEASITTCDINVNIDSKNVIQDNAIDINTLGDTADITTHNIKINLQNENKLNGTGRDILLFNTKSNIKTNNVEFNIGDKNEFNDGIDLVGRKEVNIAKIDSKIGNYNLIRNEIIDITGNEKLTISDVDIKICDGNIVSEDVIDFFSDNGDINTENINIKIGKDNIINDVIEIDTNNLGNFIAKNIIVNSESDGLIQIVASGDIDTCKIVSDAQRNSNIELFSQNNVTTGELCANNEVIIAGEQPPDIEDGKEKDIKAGDPLVKVNEVCVGNITAENLHIAANSITAGNINATGFVLLEDDVAINVGDITSSGPITLTTLDGDIVTGNLCATIGDQQTIDDLILLEVTNSGNIITKNITAKVGNGNTVNNSVVSLASASGDVTTENVNVNIASANDISSNVLIIRTSGNITTCDIDTYLNFDNNVNNGYVAALFNLGVGDVKVGNITANIGSSNTINEDSVIFLSSNEGDIQTENIMASLDASNSINDFLIGLTTDLGDITTKNITAKVNTNNSFSKEVINISSGSSTFTCDINAELNNQNTLNSNLINISGNSELTTNNISVDVRNDNTVQTDVIFVDTSASFTAQNIDAKLNNRNTINGDLISVNAGTGVSTQDITLNVGEDNTIGDEIFELLSNEDIEIKNIKVSIGENSTVDEDVEITSDTGNVKTCDIKVKSDDKGIVTIKAGKNITTGKIISDAQIASDIELLAPGDITTKDLSTNGNILIAKNITPEKANIVNVNGDISAIYLTIAANSITTGNINITGTLDLIDDIGINVGDITTAGPIILTTLDGDIITGNLTATIGNDQTIDNLILLKTGTYGDITTGTITACAGSNNTINGDAVGLVTQDGDISTKDIKVKLDSGNEIAGHVLELTAGGKISDCNINVELNDNNILADANLNPFDIVSIATTEDIARSNIMVTVDNLNEFDRAIDIDSDQDINTDDIGACIGDNNIISNDLIRLSADHNINTANIKVEIGDNNKIQSPGDVIEIIADKALTTENINVDISSNNTFGNDIIDLNSDRSIQTENIVVNIDRNNSIADNVVEIDKGTSADLTGYKGKNITVNSQSDAGVFIEAEEIIEACNITSNGLADSVIDLFTTGDVTTDNLSANGDIQISQSDLTSKADIVQTGNITADNLEIIANSINTGNINVTGSVNLQDDVAINVGDITAGGAITLTSTGGDIITGNLKATIGDGETLDDLILLQITGVGDITTKDITTCIGDDNTFNNSAIRLTASNGDLTANNITAKLGSDNTLESPAINIVSRSVKTCNISAELTDNNTINNNTNIVSVTGAADSVETNDIKVKVNDGNTFDNAILIISGPFDVIVNNLSLDIGNDNTISNTGITMLAGAGNVTTQNINANVGNNNSFSTRVVSLNPGVDLSTQNICANIGEDNTIGNDVIFLSSGQANVTTKNITADIGTNSTVGNGAVFIVTNNGDVETCDIEVNSQTNGAIKIDAGGGAITTGKIISNVQETSDIELFTSDNVTTKELSANGDIQISQNDLTSKSDIVTTGDITADNLKIIANSITTGNINATGSVNLEDDVAINVGDITAGGPIILTTVDGDIITGNLETTIEDFQILDTLILLQTTGDGNICTKNITATARNENTFSGSIIGLSAENGNISSCDISAKVGNYVDMKHVIDINTKNNVEVQNIDINMGVLSILDSDVLNITAGSGIKIKDITMRLGDGNEVGNDTVIGGDAVELNAGNDVITEDIKLDIVNYSLSPSLGAKAVNITSTSGNVITGDIEANGKFDGLVSIEALNDIETGNITSISPYSYYLNIEHAVYLYSKGNGNITAKNITASTGKGNIFTENIIGLDAASGDVKVCDIELDSESNGNISIYAENITTENITSKSSSDNGIKLFTPGNITTKELSANGDILISQNDLTSKADIVNTGDITADNLNIIANDITVGDLNVSQNIDLQDDLSIITGKIVAGDTVNITASDGCIEVNSINAREVNLFGNKIFASGNITTSGNFNASKDGTVKAEKVCVQDVTTADDLTIIADEIDFNDVNAGGNLDIIDDSYIKGNSAIAGGDVLLVSPENNIDIKTIKGNKVIFSEFRF